MVSGRIKINGFRAGLRQNSSISTRSLKVDRPADVNEREAFGVVRPNLLSNVPFCSVIYFPHVPKKHAIICRFP